MSNIATMVTISSVCIWLPSIIWGVGVEDMRQTRILPVSTRGVFKQLWVPVYVNDIKKPTQGVIIYPKHPCKQIITIEIHNDLYLLQHRKSCIEELE